MCSAFDTQRQIRMRKMEVQWLRFHLPILLLFHVLVLFFGCFFFFGHEACRISAPQLGESLKFLCKLHCLHPSHDLAPWTY